MSPPGLPTRPLRALAEVALGRMRSPDRADGPNMIPYLRAANVKDGSLDLSDVKSMDFNLSEQAAYALRAGDVLVTEGAGSLAAVGASAVWSGEIDGVVCFRNTLSALRPGEQDARYLMWWARQRTRTPGFSRRLPKARTSTDLGADNVRLLPVHGPRSDISASHRGLPRRGDGADRRTRVRATATWRAVCHDRSMVDAALVFDGEPVR